VGMMAKLKKGKTIQGELSFFQLQSWALSCLKSVILPSSPLRVNCYHLGFTNKCLRLREFE
jgi:hypothetical protein